MEAVGKLTGGVAHDFNNLLMAVLGSLEIPRKRAVVGEDVVDLIDNAIQGAKRGASLTQRLLAFSRKKELTLEPVDILGLVAGMTDLFRSIGPAVQIATSFPSSLPSVLSDINQLESALLNLLVNARDAMPGGGRIEIAGSGRTVREREVAVLAAGDYVCLSISDEGEGMDAETLELATSPFFTTKGIGKGTGLGLSMVQGLMAQSGGVLELHSTKGAGTVAELWLPIAPEIKAPAPRAEHQAVAPDKPLTVLAVDDDGLVLMNTVLMLEDLGHSTMQADCAQDALRILEGGFVPDVLITDHAMPQITGTELALKVASAYPNMAVILATGYAELPNGMDPGIARLAKPFTQAQLNAALAEAMDRQSRTMSSGSPASQ